MNADEQGYNGWSNRETWALNLWLANDHGLYDMTRERVATAVADRKSDYIAGDGWALPDYLARVAGESIKELYDELTDPAEQLMTCEAIVTMVKDVGSDYRVDWDEIGRAWLDGES